MHSNLAESTENVMQNLNQNVARAMWASSQFVASTGISDMALFDQHGAEVENPVFPYSLRYEPNPDLSYSDEEYTSTVFEQLRRIEEG